MILELVSAANVRLKYQGRAGRRTLEGDVTIERFVVAVSTLNSDVAELGQNSKSLALATGRR